MSENLPIVQYEELDDLSYEEAWAYQGDILKALVKKKRADVDDPLKVQSINRLIFCEHKPVFTLGKSGSIDHLLLTEDELANQEIEFFKINRGGDITYHGPGQLTVYPIFDLDYFFHDLHKYVRFLEEAIIRLLATYEIEATRIEGYTGVWIAGSPSRKICAIGVHLSRWVTMHGLAFNVNTDLSYFEKIIPCGIEDTDKTVTSLSKELGRNVEMSEVKVRLKTIFAELFEFEYI